MELYTKQFGLVLKNARMDKKLTQAELAEILDISLSYLKDLEGYRNNPSLEMFVRIMRYFNLSADMVVYPEKEVDNSTRSQLERLLTQCDDGQLRVLLATAEALLSLTPEGSSSDSSENHTDSGETPAKPE
ncbi:MAG: helix-turn-helix domain-containing protein [Lachnospiraceae bacterium]|nr:helix-turn-helix domain-containing protein [Lachnospiraceae bacterium]